MAALRKSMVSCRVERRKDVISAVHNMEIGCPTNVRHITHVTFDQFNGFLGLPVEFEVEVPCRVPSASARLDFVSLLFGGDVTDRSVLRCGHPPKPPKSAKTLVRLDLERRKITFDIWRSKKIACYHAHTDHTHIVTCNVLQVKFAYVILAIDAHGLRSSTWQSTFYQQLL
ncbi:hypothetical protein KPL70_014306 [Citrus sinensis]|nr:hypothetical protein KPL70_014306 [Citrus sinensis]